MLIIVPAPWLIKLECSYYKLINLFLVLFGSVEAREHLAWSMVCRYYVFIIIKKNKVCITIKRVFFLLYFEIITIFSEALQCKHWVQFVLFAQTVYSKLVARLMVFTLFPLTTRLVESTNWNRLQLLGHSHCLESYGLDNWSHMIKGR